MAWFVAWYAPYPSPAFKFSMAEHAEFDVMARAVGEILISEWQAKGRDLYVDPPGSKNLLDFRTADRSGRLNCFIPRPR